MKAAAEVKEEEPEEEDAEIQEVDIELGLSSDSSFYWLYQFTDYSSKSHPVFNGSFNVHHQIANTTIQRAQLFRLIWTILRNSEMAETGAASQ